MATTDKINIDFQLFSTGDPKVLVIVDTSVWSFIEDKTAIIEIVPPNSSNTIIYTYAKNKTNVFNTSNLLLSAVGTFNDMPDGIYSVTVKGSPSSFCKHRDVLKTDKTRLELYKLYTSLGTGVEKNDSPTLDKIKEVKFLIEAAEALVSVGETYKGLKKLQMAMKSLRDYGQCKECE